MIIRGLIKKGEYFDSVTLMIVSKEINQSQGVIDSSIVMGTNENKAILKTAGLLLPEFAQSNDTDLLISIKAEDEIQYQNALQKIDQILKATRSKSNDKGESSPKSLKSALKIQPDSNLVLISVAGKFAASEARTALNNGMHVMIFSDNVTIAEELELKKLAIEKGLLMMGPDCGTAIINGIPLAFANVVNRGNIGVVAASGTGLQEVTSIISNAGAGISQALATGGRDVKKEIGGMMFIECLKALNNDPETKIILLVSKPPHPEVLEKIAAEIKNITKPVVGVFIGGNPDVLQKAGAIATNTLEEAALIATQIAKNQELNDIKADIIRANSQITILAKEFASKATGKYLRGLFSGGTLCDEAQLVAKPHIGDCYSNTPLNQDFLLINVWKSKKNTIIDLGDDEFTAGRPHPMIDFSLRNKRIIEEAQDPETAVILFDLVIGYGSNLQPEKEFVPIFEQAKKINPKLLLIGSITGTDKDPQNRKKLKSDLENAGAIIMNSNVSASLLAARIIEAINK